MNENDQLLPDDADPVLDGHLHSLHRVAPRPGFENRVLSRVWRPAPMFLLVWQDRLRRAVTPRRMWTAAGLAAAGSTAWLAGIMSLLSSRFDPAFASAWLANDVAVPAWTAGTTAVGTWANAAAEQAALMAPVGGTTFTIAAGVLLLPAISAAGLYLVMRRTARERARSYAAR